MKQVSNAIKSFVLSSPRQHPIHQRRSFLNCISIFLFLCIALFATSCQKESLQSISQSQDLLSSQKPNLPKTSVPLKAKFTVDLRNGVVGTGEGTHIGKFTLVSQDNNENFPYITGTTIITAANGDQIFATHTGFFKDLGNGIADVNFHGTITGGTGRFAGATGSYENHVIVDEALGTGSGSLDGTISY